MSKVDELTTDSSTKFFWTMSLSTATHSFVHIPRQPIDTSMSIDEPKEQFIIHYLTY